MCGIAGYVTTRPQLYPEAVLERMTSAIAHRGPDGCGYFRDSLAALGHRRLSIIDLAGGAQPMYNEDRSLVVTYNGEIFNHASLRASLEQAGHRYRSRSDTEMILHSYEEYGPECLARYRGMFAFALWNRERRELFCARDRLGIKPFYYYWDGSLFVFASEIKALLEHPAISASLDESVLAEYLAFGYTGGERTLFSGIRQLLPGHWLAWRAEGSKGGLEIRQYWDAPKGPAAARGMSETEYVDACARRLEETVRMRLMSDVPLGMFLSGGVDSSVIAALMKTMTPEVNTFAVGYSEAPFSELEHARTVSAHLGTRHHEVVVSGREFFEALPRLIWHEDEPITWPSSVSLYFVSKLAASEVKVVLTGEGSDELFGGYARYRHCLRDQSLLRAYRWAPGRLRRAIRRGIASSRLLSGGLRRKLQHTILGRGESIESLYLDNYYCAFPAGDPVTAGVEGEPYQSYLQYWESAAGSSPLGRLLYADQKTYLVELLRKQDRMSMACSIESRVPFLDHLLVEFAGGVPDHLKIRGSTTKYLLKRAVEPLLPAAIIHRPKMGFPTPLREWLSGSALGGIVETLHDRNGLLAGFLDRRALEDLLERHAHGREDATDRIWRLLNLQLWGDVFLTGRREALWERSLFSAQ